VSRDLNWAQQQPKQERSYCHLEKNKPRFRGFVAPETVRTAPLTEKICRFTSFR